MEQVQTLIPDDRIQSMEPIIITLAAELGVQPQQVAAAVHLLDDGSTVPFIARYRKEVTGGPDDTQLRTLEERLPYLREPGKRRQVILPEHDPWGRRSSRAMTSRGSIRLLKKKTWPGTWAKSSSETFRSAETAMIRS